MAGLLFYECSAHLSDFFFDKCIYYDVIPIQEPVSSSDQVQILDIGIQKNIMKILPFTNQIVSIIDSFYGFIDY